jgi:hypothetical protein
MQEETKRSSVIQCSQHISDVDWKKLVCVFQVPRLAKLVSKAVRHKV